MVHHAGLGGGISSDERVDQDDRFAGIDAEGGMAECRDFHEDLLLRTMHHATALRGSSNRVSRLAMILERLDEAVPGCRRTRPFWASISAPRRSASR